MQGNPEPGRLRRLLAVGGLLSVAVIVLLLVASGESDPARHTAPGARASRAGPGPPASERPAVRRPPAGHLQRRRPVPVLMYHGVEEPVPSGIANLFVSPEDFRAQMRALARRGAHGVTMAQVMAAWHRGMPLPPKPVVLTFDDGYRGQVTNALPELRRRGWPGVLYLCVANLRSPSGLRDDDVRRLQRSDWELGGHTFSHSDLRTLAPYQLSHEIAESRRWIQRRFGAPVKSFAYPAGMYDGRTVKAVRRAGFSNAVTVVPGLARRNRPFELNRIRVSRDTTAAMLLSELDDLGWH